MCIEIAVNKSVIIIQSPINMASSKRTNVDMCITFDTGQTAIKAYRRSRCKASATSG